MYYVCYVLFYSNDNFLNNILHLVSPTLSHNNITIVISVQCFIIIIYSIVSNPFL